MPYFLKEHIQKKFINETLEENAEEIFNQIREGPLTLLNVAQYIMVIGYYLFILILAIQLHSRKKLSMTNTVVVAILIPLAPIFYIFTLRKPLKELQNLNNPGVKQSSNYPGIR